MNQYTHCGHGKTYAEECLECECVWASEVTLQHARELVARLMRFYSVADLRKLIFAQDRQIERLQGRMPPSADMKPGRVREG